MRTFKFTQYIREHAKVFTKDLNNINTKTKYDKILLNNSQIKIKIKLEEHEKESEYKINQNIANNYNIMSSSITNNDNNQKDNLSKWTKEYTYPKVNSLVKYFLKGTK